MSDRFVHRPKPSGVLAVSGATESATAVAEKFYHGMVVDVIVDHNHPEYAKKDGFNVGDIKIRIFSRDNTLEFEQLDWASPIDFEVKQLPLVGETVLIQKVLSKFYYYRRLPATHRIQESGLLKIDELIDQRRVNSLSSAAAGGEEVDATPHKFGSYWKPDIRVRPIKHFEGDTIVEGRMGHTIRFGSSQMDPATEDMAPNIIIRTGQAKDIEEKEATKPKYFGLIMEDVNEDASTVWMTSNQNIPFEPATIDNDGFYRSIQNPPHKFDKATVLGNSDRIILNAKKTHIMLFANEEIYLNSFSRIGMDTDDTIFMTAYKDISQRASRNIDHVADKNYVINAGKHMLVSVMDSVSIVSKKIYVGSEKDETEPIVCGQLLAKWLNDFIKAHLDPVFHVITPTGPGKLHPQVIAKLKAVQKRLNGFIDAEFNSRDNWTMFKNEGPVIELNGFAQGKQYESENNKWVLSDKAYYKIEPNVGIDY